MGVREAAPGLDLFEKEPAGEAYRAILDFAAEHCHAFALVWGDQLPFEPPARELARRLQPWLCYERHAHECSGTRLLGGKARVRYSTMTKASVEIDAKADRLDAWLSPDLPEDLAFYRSDGMGWLGSTSHEGDGWLDLGTFGPDTSRDLLRVLAEHQVISVP
ncbi:hypothetical protein HK102_012271 [Quaeritorhiza haematococci]|nr:hypothetical protein HK102_012271 [Quaeritorhiza haematococci]